MPSRVDNTLNTLQTILCDAASITKTSDKTPRSKQATSSRGLETCKLYGCSAPVWEDPTNNTEFDYCSRTHADAARSRGELPAQNNNIARSFSGNSTSGKWSLNLLSPSHPKHGDVKHQFESQWSKPTDVQVVRIYQIITPPSVHASFNAIASVRGNVHRRFHGTGQTCNVGVDPNAGPCESSSCPICNICRVGFSLDFVNQRAGGPGMNWLRYGPGLYFSNCSGKSNDYTSTVRMQPGPRGNQPVQHRTMLLCKVALGMNRQTIVDEKDLTKQTLNMQGFHSISGIVAPPGQGGTLNHPEDVVFDAEAAVPSYLITYAIY